MGYVLHVEVRKGPRLIGPFLCERLVRGSTRQLNGDKLWDVECGPLADLLESCLVRELAVEEDL